jgi:hypothetical protein
LNRLLTLTLFWLILTGIIEICFVVWFRVNGDGRADYGEVFTRERYMRETLHSGAPCVFIPSGGAPCTRDQVDAWHRLYTHLFWQDVLDLSRPYLLLSLLIFLGVAAFVIVRTWKDEGLTRRDAL